MSNVPLHDLRMWADGHFARTHDRLMELTTHVRETRAREERLAREVTALRRTVDALLLRLAIPVPTKQRKKPQKKKAGQGRST